MLQTTARKNPVVRFKKSSVGRMLIAVYVLVVLAWSATAKAETMIPQFEIRNQISK